jgi:tripartite-type tricarboxylate transporter receptor subunit TctC
MKKILIILLVMIYFPAYANWPERKISVIVPLAPGNGTDLISRIVSDELSDRYKMKFVVENKVGASSTIGTNFVINSIPDGYTILITSSTLISSKLTLLNTKYNIQTDLIPISIIAETPMVLVVSPKKFQSIEELIKTGKEKELLYGTVGYGGSTHFVSADFSYQTKIKTNIIPYKGTIEAQTDLLGERIDFLFIPMQTAIEYHKSKKLKILGIVSENRSSIIPDVPTFNELGYKNIKFIFWVGMFAPKNTPSSIINNLIDSINIIKTSSKFNDKITTIGAKIFPIQSSSEINNFLINQNKYYFRIMQESNIEVK